MQLCLFCFAHAGRGLPRKSAICLLLKRKTSFKDTAATLVYCLLPAVWRPRRASLPPFPALLLQPPRDSQVGSNDLSALERVAGLDLLESLDGACLDAEHVAPAVVGSKVGHGLCLCLPGVPYDDVVEVVADDGEDLAAGLGDGDGCLGPAGGGVDAVCLAGEGEGAGLGLDGEVVGLVDVGGVVEALDLDCGDVLEVDCVSGSSVLETTVRDRKHTLTRR